jgi:glycosyltransferase involved in cell wall biosynthesis
MNVLFALYYDLTCNSASHVDGIARQLAARGCDCLVAMPEKVRGAERFAPLAYRVATFADVLKEPRSFADGRGPDVFHAWTPRELNRRFHARLAEQCRFRTVIHLEDNEEHVARCNIGEAAYRRAAADPQCDGYPQGLSHPRRYVEFLEQADGATLLIDSLGKFVPIDRPRVEFWPAVDASIWHARPRNDALRQELGISPEMWVLAYHGNTHVANAAEVRSLYLAVALLNSNGVAARLIRMGTDYTNPPQQYRQWAAEFTIDMGFVVDRRRIADVLAAADVFVQPGASDPFNDYRFPSKLPEFFALGRPVVLPRTNIGLVTRHLQDAYVLDEANGAAICDAIAHIRREPELYKQLAAGAEAFGLAHFCWQNSAGKVWDFYNMLNATSQRAAA